LNRASGTSYIAPLCGLTTDLVYKYQASLEKAAREKHSNLLFLNGSDV